MQLKSPIIIRFKAMPTERLVAVLGGSCNDCRFLNEPSRFCERINKHEPASCSQRGRHAFVSLKNYKAMKDEK